MKRTDEKKNTFFKSMKPYDRPSMHGPGPGPSTSTSPGTNTDLMPYIPVSDSDATSSAQATAGGSEFTQNSF